VCSNKNKYYTGDSIYVREVKIERDGDKYGPFYQVVRSYREGGKVKQHVVHLGQYETVDEALAAWPQEIKELYQIGRPKQAEKLQVKLDRLRELNREEQS
jgi:hypothetical protein